MICACCRHVENSADVVKLIAAMHTALVCDSVISSQQLVINFASTKYRTAAVVFVTIQKTWRPRRNHP